MDDSKKLTLIALTCCAFWTGFSYAGCDASSFAGSSAGQSCRNPSFRQYSYDGSDDTYCDVTAECKTGRTYPENPNALQSREITEWVNTTITTTDIKVNTLVNRSGRLSN